MTLKDAIEAERTRRQHVEEAARRPYEEAHALLKAMFHQITDDPDFRESLHAEIELNGDELQIDPGPIFIVVSVDAAGDYHMTCEIKSSSDPVITTVEVKTIPDIEKAIARLLVNTMT